MKYSCLVIFFLWTTVIYAQVDTLPAYFMEDEQVVLEFDIRKYEQAQQHEFSKIFEMEGVDVLSIVKEQDNWSKNGWYLKKIGQYIYQLRKDLDTFDNPIDWKSKYRINGDYWAQPTSELSHPTLPENTFKAEPRTAVVSDSGAVAFQLTGFKDAKKVILSGSFNQWNEEAISMRPTESGWTIKLDLTEGIYEYKFIVDGIWMHDPANLLKIKNEHHTWNSILLVGKTITFRLPGHEEAKRVVLSGSFNNWNRTALAMLKDSKGWYLELPLPPGKHYYKFIVDEMWVTDPDNDLQQPDRLGRWNSVLLIN